jgi:hypothetical protein
VPDCTFTSRQTPNTERMHYTPCRRLRVFISPTLGSIHWIRGNVFPMPQFRQSRTSHGLGSGMAAEDV